MTFITPTRKNLGNFFIFDFDYTLADSSQGVIECVNFALKEMGLKTAYNKDICRTIGLTLGNVFTKLTGQTQNELLINEFRAIFKKRADEVMANYTFIYKFVSDTLKELKDKGNLLGIVSTKFRYRIETILKRERIFDLFDIIVGSEDVKNPKPDPEGVLKVIKKINIPLSKCIFVGDSVTDAETAKNANIKFIASLTGTTTKKEFKMYKVNKFIKDISELVEFSL